MTDDFHSLQDVGWYPAAYLLTNCCLQLLYGKMYTFFSVKVVFVSAITIFEIGSAICGSAPSSNIVIIGRAIQGVGGSGITAGAVGKFLIRNILMLS